MNLTKEAMKGAIAPYMFYVKLVCVGVLSAALFIGGCSFGENKRADDLAAKDVALGSSAAEIATLRAANATYESAVAGANRNVEANRRFAEEKQAEVEAARQETVKAQQTLKAREAEWKKGFAAAMNDARCAELMRSQVCAVAPMPSRR